MIRMIEEKTSREKATNKLFGQVSFAKKFKVCSFTEDKINLIDKEIEKTKKAIAKNENRINNIDAMINLMLQEEQNLVNEIRENYIRRYFLLIANKQHNKKISRLNSLRKTVIVNAWSMACMLK